MIEAQGGDPRVTDDPSLLPAAPVRHPLLAERDGWLAAVDTAAVGWLAAGLGAGRQRKDDRIDPAVGMEVLVKLGDKVTAGMPLGWVHARDQEAAEHAAAGLAAALTLGNAPVTPPPLVHRRIGAEGAR